MKTQLLLLFPLVAFAETPLLPSGWKVHDRERPQPPIVEPGATDSAPPSDAVVLFDGSDLSAWNGQKVDNEHMKNPDGKPRWRVEDGAMKITPTGSLRTKKAFGDIQLHIEWATPNPPTLKAEQRGNSGIFLMGKYELQVLDGWENHGYADGMMAAIYGQTPPLVNASRPPGEWQSYDIIFTAPRFEDGKLLSPARITAFHNGLLVQLNTEILGPTHHHKRLPYVAHPARMPLMLQNHGQAVRYRNIWVRELN